MLSALGRDLAAASPGTFWASVVVLGGGALAGFFLAFRQLRQARLIQDTPTSRARSAAQGYVELEGCAQLMPGPAIVSPLSRTHCLWWRYTVEHREDSLLSDNRQQKQWRVIDQSASDDVFLLVDDSGECIIDPYRAEIVPSLKRRWRGSTPRPIEIPARSPWLDFGDYRYTEELISTGAPLYVLGQFRSQSSVLSEDQAGDVRELLQEWKRDQRELLRRFDTNRDGTIDMAEWDAARAAALAEVRAGQLERSLHTDLHVLCKPQDGRRFLISALPQARLVRRMQRFALAMLGAALLAGSGAVWLFAARGIRL